MGQNASTGLKTANFRKMVFSSRTREYKSPIHRKGLFVAFKTFSESQLHTGIKLYARDGVIIVQLVLLTKYIVQQCKG